MVITSQADQHPLGQPDIEPGREGSAGPGHPKCEAEHPKRPPLWSRAACLASGDLERLSGGCEEGTEDLQNFKRGSKRSKAY